MSEYKIIPHKAIDFKKWDATVLNSKLPLVFAQSFYLNATAPNWKALVGNNYELIVPLTEGKKLNVTYLFQPPFTPQLGVFGKLEERVVDECMAFIKSNYKFIEIELNASNKLKKTPFKEKQTYIIDFSKPFKHNDNTKRNIAKAKKSSISIVEMDFKEALKLAKNELLPWLHKELEIPEKHGKILLNLISGANENNALKTFKAEDKDGKILSIGYFVFNKFHAVFLKGMSFNKKDNSGSMHLLMSDAINYFKDKTNLFDFGGGSAPGLASFYKGLGGVELNYAVVRVNNLPWPLKVIKK